MIGTNLLDSIDTTKIPNKEATPEGSKEQMPVVGAVEMAPEINTEVNVSPISQNIPTHVGGTNNITPSSIAENKSEFMNRRASFEKTVTPTGPEVTRKPGILSNFNWYAIKAVLVNFMIPLVCFGVSLLLIIFVLFPSIKSREPLKAELASKQQLKKILSDKNSKLDTLYNLKSIFDESLKVIDQTLPSDELVPELLTQIYYLSKDLSGMTVGSLAYSGSVKTGVSVPTVSASLSLGGSLDQFINFLKLTENSSRALVINTFRYSVGQDERLALNVTVDSPYLTVKSDAVTDDPIKLDINNIDYQKFLTKVKSLTYYDPAKLEPFVPTPPPEQPPEQPAE